MLEATELPQQGRLRLVPFVDTPISAPRDALDSVSELAGSRYQGRAKRHPGTPWRSR